MRGFQGFNQGRILQILFVFGVSTLRCVERAVPPQREPTIGATAAAEQLSVAFLTSGQPNELPEHIDIAVKGAAGAADHPALVRWVSEPALTGEVKWVGPELLRITPVGLKHDTAYRIALQEVQVMDRSFHSRRGDGSSTDPSWETTLRTPAFAATRIDLFKVDPTRHRVTVALGFSGPVELASVKKQLKLVAEKGDASNTGKVKVISSAQPRPNEVEIEVSLEPFTRPLTVRVLAGVLAKDGSKTTTDLAKTKSVNAEAELTVSDPRLRENDEGYFFELGCSDPQTRNQWNYWDNPDEQCAIDPDTAARYIQVSTTKASARKQKITVGRGRGVLRVFGEFPFGEYRVLVRSGLATSGRSVLLRDIDRVMTVPRRRAQVGFAGSGRYLPRGSVARTPITHLNTERVLLSIRRVQPENAVFWLTNRTERMDDRVSDQVLSQAISVRSPVDEKVTTQIDVAALLGTEPSGTYELTLTPAGSTRDDTLDEESGQHNQRAVARVVFTDLILVAKRAGDQLHVWVRNVHTLAPVGGVNVGVFTMSNQLVASAVSDGEGQVLLDHVTDPRSHKPPFVITAQKGKDYTYLELSDLEVPLNDAEVSGAPYNKSVVYDGVVYADRGVYRPGETAHLVAMVREAGLAPATSVPVVGKVYDSKKRLVQALRGTTNPAGLVPFDVVLQGFADTGRYELVLEVANVELTREGFHVEEFMPERMRVTAKPVVADIAIGDEASIAIEAKYLFGAKAKNERVELQCRLEPSTFRPAERSDYYFGLYGDVARPSVKLESVEGELDEEGRATLACPKLVGEWQGEAEIHAFASVFEAGSGRATVDSTVVKAHPAGHYLGLKGPKKTSDGAQITVNGIVVDWQGKAQSAAALRALGPQATITLHRLEPQYQWEYVDGRYTWTVNQRMIQESQSRVNLEEGGKFTYAFKAQGTGSGFVVDAVLGNARTMLKLDSDRPYYWYSGASDGDTPRPFKPTQLRITPPDALRVGHASAVSIAVPYAGRMLVTIESDELIDAEWVDVKPGDYRHEVRIDRFAPNVYVSALLLKDPHAESQKAFLPARAFGVRSVSVVPEKHKLDVLLTAPSEVRPNSLLEVSLDVSANGKSTDREVFATVAAVDEGVLQLTRFRTPQLLQSLFRPRALGVVTYETFGWAMMLADSDKSPGGDRSTAAEERVAPVKPVALWSGILSVPANGKLVVKLPIPMFRGELRVMAQAVGSARMGSAQARVVVRDPLVLQATLPRFLLDGDKFVAPVSVTNLTGTPTEVTVSVQATGGIQWSGVTLKKIKLKRDEAQVVTFAGEGRVADGPAHVTVNAVTFQTSSRDEVDVPLLPNGPVTHETKAIELKRGDNDLSGALSGWAPLNERTNVWVTNHRYGREMTHLRYLVRYPYGCVEQTTSSLRPMLFVSSLVGSIDSDLLKDGTVEQKVMYGVRRLLSMQTPSGGFAYWPGANDPNAWGTAYATHALLDAKAAGFPVPDDRMQEAMRYMENVVTNGAAHQDAHAQAYMLYVLAKAGRANQAAMRALLADSKTLNEEQRFLLRAGLYLAGDRRFEADLRIVNGSAITKKRTNDWSYWSELRTRGLQLAVLEDLFPGAASSEALAEAVASSLRESTSDYYTTQELAWAVSALGKRSSSGADKWSIGKLTGAGKAVAALPKSGRDDLFTLTGASGRLPLHLQVDAVSGGTLFAFVSVSGIKPNVPHRIGEHGVTIERRYTSGGVDANTEVKLGGLVEVELVLTNETKRKLNNIALVDRVPAGLEIENARLNRQGGQTTDDTWVTDYMNLRDDRIELFGHLEPGQRVVVRYLARAVTSGVFTVPPVTSEAMYEPEVWAAEPGKSFAVTHAWKGM